MVPTPVFLSGKFHRQRSLVGYCPWGHRELDMTEWLSTHQWLTYAWRWLHIAWVIFFKIKIMYSKLNCPLTSHQKYLQIPERRESMTEVKCKVNGLNSLLVKHIYSAIFIKPHNWLNTLLASSEPWRDLYKWEPWKIKLNDKSASEEKVLSLWKAKTFEGMICNESNESGF